MFASRPLYLLLAIVAAICLAQASALSSVKANTQSLDARQEADNSPDSTPTSVPGPPESSTTSDSSLSSSSSTSVPEPPSTTSTSSSTSIPEQPTTSSTSTTSVQLPSSTSESSNGPPPSSTSEHPESSSSVPMSTFTSIVTKTRDDGSKETQTKTGTLPIQTDKSSGSSGISNTRQTIIGVVVGVGGAIVLGALGLVGWRIWGRKKHNEEQDGLMDYNMGTGGVEKHESTGPINGSNQQQTPFQSTLEDYHQPGHVNASSNF